ncbi:hypothetical protein H5T52_09715, partial [Candidatus Bipolaricaulota bacterium]|nr:hypothetical protein [Candidatus Bipolaricaulota bacterium]
SAHRLAERAFRQRVRSERERTKAIRDIETSLQTLSLDQLHKLQGFIQRLRASSP